MSGNNLASTKKGRQWRLSQRRFEDVGAAMRKHWKVAQDEASLANFHGGAVEPCTPRAHPGAETGPNGSTTIETIVKAAAEARRLFESLGFNGWEEQRTVLRWVAVGTADEWHQIAEATQTRVQH